MFFVQALQIFIAFGRVAVVAQAGTGGRFDEAGWFGGVATGAGVGAQLVFVFAVHGLPAHAFWLMAERAVFYQGGPGVVAERGKGHA